MARAAPVIGALSVVRDVLVPLGVLATVVTSVGTVNWLKGKRWLALLAPLSIVSVIGIVGAARVAKPGSPWARWRYGDDRMAQACARFGVPAPERPTPVRAAGFVPVLIGVVAGVPLGAVTSLAGGVLLGHAWLARSGRDVSARVCAGVAGAGVVGQAVLVAVTLPDLAALPGAATTAVVAAGALLLCRPVVPDSAT